MIKRLADMAKAISAIDDLSKSDFPSDVIAEIVSHCNALHEQVEYMLIRSGCTVSDVYFGEKND